MHTQTPGFTTFKDKILILYVLVINCDPRTAVCWFSIWLICDFIFLEFICFYVLKIFLKNFKKLFFVALIFYIYFMLLWCVDVKNKLKKLYYFNIFSSKKNTLKINY
jgi:hypothetical protein